MAVSIPATAFDNSINVNVQFLITHMLCEHALFAAIYKCISTIIYILLCIHVIMIVVYVFM